MKSKRELLIPATATITLAFGGSACNGESRYELYERACEKIQKCRPEAFTPGGDDRFYSSIEDCAEESMQYVGELVREYTTGAECYEAGLDLYDCYVRTYADSASCEFEDYSSYEHCIDEYEDVVVACDINEYGYYDE
jgi:hypothetical protein